jgi:hypothetical protein
MEERINHWKEHLDSTIDLAEYERVVEEALAFVEDARRKGEIEDAKPMEKFVDETKRKIAFERAEQAYFNAVREHDDLCRALAQETQTKLAESYSRMEQLRVAWVKTKPWGPPINNDNNNQEEDAIT